MNTELLPKYLRRKPIYEIMFGYVRSLEVHMNMKPEESMRFFMKEFAYDEEIIGITKDSLVREYGRMKSDFLNQA